MQNHRVHYWFCIKFTHFLISKLDKLQNMSKDLSLNITITLIKMIKAFPHPYYLSSDVG
jgi:hypothetical protein